MTDSSPAHASSPAAIAPAALTIDDLAFGYESSELLIDSLSVSLAPGRVCGVLGPNAAGKSTLMKLLLGELSPWRGKILVGDQPLESIPAAQRAAMISYVPQRGGTSFAFTVGQVVEMGRFALSRDAAAVDAALEACDLTHLRHRVYSQLSVGQQQRVLLARAMAQCSGQGKIMLLDEPGSAMDLRHVHTMMQTLVKLAQQGVAVLLVLHDLNVAVRYCDDIWLMDQGKLVQSGPWDQVMEPKLLSSVYQMQLTRMTVPHEPRPVFTASSYPYT